MKKTSKIARMSDIKIKSVDGIEYDEITGFTLFTDYPQDKSLVTVVYLLNGKQRQITLESEAVQYEADV